MRRHPRGEDLAHRLDRQHRAALHVLDARAVAFVALAPDRQFRQRADRMHRVEMRQHQDARRRIPGRMREARAHAVAQAHAARDAVDPRAQQRQVARREVHHPVHRRRVEGRALAGRPAHQPGEDLLGVEGQGGGGEVGHACVSGDAIGRSLHPRRRIGQDRGRLVTCAPGTCYQCVHERPLATPPEARAPDRPRRLGRGRPDRRGLDGARRHRGSRRAGSRADRRRRPPPRCRR